MAEEVTFSDLIVPFEYSFTFPLDKVWPFISDFGGWGKWYPHFSECKIIGDGISKIGAIAITKSSKSNIAYESVLLVRDHVEHILSYALVKRDPPVPWIKNQVNKYHVVSTGENETKVIGTATITPTCQVSEETFEQYKAGVNAAIKSLFGCLEEHLNSQKQSYPDFVFPYEASFTNPIDKVWACIEDFAGWGKWYPPLADMKIIGDGIDKVGAIRVVKSAATGITYEEVQRAKDPKEHRVEYGIFKRDPPVPFMKYQIVSAKLVSKGENETQLIGEVAMTPNCELSEETKENYKALVQGAFKKVYGGLEETLNSQKQQQTFPDFIFPYEASFTHSIDKVWACIEDFAGWGKWYPPLADMKIIGDGIDKVGAIRVVKSAATGITYEEVQRAKDPVEHRVEYGIFKRDPPVPFMKYQIVSAKLVSKGENETQLIGEVAMTPNCELSEEIKENYKALVQGAFKKVYGGLEETLNSQKQPSQN